MSILKDIKIPKMKFKKIKMKDIENIQELQVDYSSINQDKQMIYEPTRYTTIKEVFINSTDKYQDKEFILEKFNKKGN